jgi:integrase
VLWLTEGGLPMPMAAWEAVFMRASARCRRFGLDIDVTPHMLRHTFAVHMLTLRCASRWRGFWRNARAG